MPPQPKQNWRVWVFIFLLALTAVLVGYITKLSPKTQNKRLIANPKPLATPKQADVVTREFALAQVAKKIFAPLVFSEEKLLARDVAGLARLRVGGVVVFGKDITKSQAVMLREQLARYPTWHPVVVVDHEGGSVQRFSGEGFTHLPSWQKLCKLSQENRRRLLDKSFAELRSVGVTTVLAPVVDLGTDNPVLADRICSDNSKLVVTAASDYIEAAKQANLTPVLKHYPGLGQTKIDSHQSLEVIDPDPQSLNIFSHLLSAYPDLLVMVGHVAIAGKDPNIPCSLSQPCIAALKDSFPQAVVVSDALEMGAAKRQDTLADTAIQALRAGNDYLLFGNTVEFTQVQTVIQALADKYQQSAEFAALLQ